VSQIRVAGWRPTTLIVACALLTWLAVPPASGQQHVPNGTRVDYPSYPPTSGTHWPQWADWGIHPEPVREEMFVHNLEHGGVVLLYRCGSPCPDLVRELTATLQALPPSKYGHAKVVITPNDRIKTRFALLAWTRLDEFDTLDRERILRFVRAYQDRGPEDVP
jgi:hypothetical protein